MAPFDPHHQWLGIPVTARPISKYRLLGLMDFELDRGVIGAAAERQTIYLRTLQAGEHEVLVAQLLNEVSQARVTLLNADQKAEYDEELRRQQTPEPVPEPTPPPIPVVQTPAPTPVVVRGTVTQEFPVSVVQAAKKPRRRKPQEIWKRPAEIGVSMVGVIGVFVLVISLMFSGDADPVVRNVPPVVSVPLILSPEPVPAQATANTLPTSLREGLVAYYPFNGNARDESGNARDIEKLYHSWTDGVGGQAKGAVRFRRGSKRIAVPRSLQEARYEFTVSLWARIALDLEPGRIFPTVFGKGGAGMGSGYGIYLSPNASLKEGWLAAIHLADGSKSLHFASDEMVPLSQGVWYHLVLTCSKDIARLYANNQDVQSHENVPDTARADEAPILIGGNAHGGGTQCWDGAIDNVRIYNRALSEAEVKALYDYEKP
jgi:hypothetical protein